MKSLSIQADATICALYRAGAGGVMSRPLFVTSISAGFPSPADDYIDRGLDLNEFLIRHPAATFFVKVAGDSMINAGIHSGDILIVDRAEKAGNRSVIIAVLNGELTVKRLVRDGARAYLVPENEAFSPLELTPEMNFEIWGVVVHVIHTVHPPHPHPPHPPFRGGRGGGGGGGGGHEKNIRPR